MAVGPRPLLLALALLALAPPAAPYSPRRDRDPLPAGGSFRVRRQSHRGGRPQISGLSQLVPALTQISQRLRSVDSKLNRHEYREAQVADFTSKTLNALTRDYTKASQDLAKMATQLAAVEERLIATLTVVTTSDERQREMLGQMTEALDRLLVASTQPALGRAPGPPPPPPEMVTASLEAATEARDGVRTLLVEVERLRDEGGEGRSEVAGQLDAVQSAVEEGLGALQGDQRAAMHALHECAARNELTESAAASSQQQCQELTAAVSGQLDSISELQIQQGRLLQDMRVAVEQGVQMENQGLEALFRELKEEESSNGGSFDEVIENLNQLGDVTQASLEDLHHNFSKIVEHHSGVVKQKMEDIQGSLKDGQTNILGILDDSASMTDNLHETVLENYKFLSKEISGLNKVERVMMNTADAVLDTKRSIEFGIQQVILELGDIVSKSGSTMNSTLSDQISKISFNILKNQTSALTNMTRRMEGEISQVWRQIGIMYQQVERSIGMLNNLQNTTDLHMNVSLNRVGNMDGTVGEINGKVATVEDNLNFLLGRLTLVTSEFNQMRAGVGDELNKLREMAQEISISGQDDENIDNLKYKINRKRHITP